jgi:hypothetical protein
MKVYLVFLGFLFIGVHFLVFQQELSRYLLVQEMLKQAAEECAIQAALLVEEEELLQGAVVFVKNQKDSQEYFLQACRQLGVSGPSEMTLVYEDDSVGYQSENQESRPRVTATVQVSVSGLFRVAPLRNRIIARSACYEIF